jgi:hypothetical protein
MVDARSADRVSPQGNFQIAISLIIKKEDYLEERPRKRVLFYLSGTLFTLFASNGVMSEISSRRTLC